MRRVIAQHRLLAKAKGLRLEVLGSDTGLKVRSDATALERILNNLLSNAIRYTDCGTVAVALRCVGGRLRVQVRDSGCGIAQTDHARIFEEFHQVGGSVGDGKGGVGLGLATVRRLVDTLGVPLAVRSCPGRGSTFTFALPLAATCESAGATGLAAPESSAASCDVLQGAVVWLFNGESAKHFSCAPQLVQWGMVLLPGGTGDACSWPAPGAGIPQLLLGDAHLATPAGLQLIDRCRTFGGRKLQAVILSGSDDQLQREVAAAQGLHWLPDPVKPARLRATLMHLLAAAH